MSLSVYKPGQGYWTRVLSAVGGGALVLAAVAWIWNEMELIRNDYAIYIRAGTAVTLVAVFGGLLWWVLNKPRVVDFMIATEGEMRKVNWPTQREIVGSTWIVIMGTFMMALLLWVVNLAFVSLFQAIHILESGG